MNKNSKILSVIAIVVLALAVIGATFAYFQAQGGDAVTRDVEILTHTVDTLSFNISNNISIEATQQNFTDGGNNLSGEATATAVLTPNSKTGGATEHYNMYLNITNNEIGYSAANIHYEPELLLQVFDLFEHWCLTATSESEGLNDEICLIDSTQSDFLNMINYGNEYIKSEESCLYYLDLFEEFVEDHPEFGFPNDYTIACEQGDEIQLDLAGLGNKVTVNGVIGYNITDKDGLIRILNNHEITASNNMTTTENYRVVVTIINHDFNQNDNTGKEIEASLIVQKEEYMFSGVIYSNNINTTINGMHYLNGEEINNETYDGIVDHAYSPYKSRGVMFYNSYSGNYLKYTILNNIIQDTKVCVNYNNHEFCIGPDYWDTDAATTKDKLQADMESEYGVGNVTCEYLNDNHPYCYLPNKVTLFVYESSVKCSYNTNHPYINRYYTVDSNGIAFLAYV